MSHMVRRSMLPSQCSPVRASNLSDPLVTFRTNYPDLNIKHCDSLRNLQISQDVLETLPSDFTLDPRGTGPQTGLDAVKLAVSRCDLAPLWLCRDCKGTFGFASGSISAKSFKSICKSESRGMCCLCRGLCFFGKP